MYYCIQCNELHLRSESEQKHIFNSGFHYIDSNLYHAGVCNNDRECDCDVFEKQLATA
ncbi:DUF3973 domain-containing protein [Paenibacillus aestuarii]|uniref:DUF3973 domain-containing protein n=1 Tax=Paenibacillus aestuarii TaxID=516965 RepID=A0ABW0KF59_9BACL